MHQLIIDEVQTQEYLLYAKDLVDFLYAEGTVQELKIHLKHCCLYSLSLKQKLSLFMGHVMNSVDEENVVSKCIVLICNSYIPDSLKIQCLQDYQFIDQQSHMRTHQWKTKIKSLVENMILLENRLIQ